MSHPDLDPARERWEHAVGPYRYLLREGPTRYHSLLWVMRTPKPTDLLRAIRDDEWYAIGPENNRAIEAAATEAYAVVLAWGANARRHALARRVVTVESILKAVKAPNKILRIGGPLLKGGVPRHPLMAAYALGLVQHRIDR